MMTKAAAESRSTLGIRVACRRHLDHVGVLVIPVTAVGNRVLARIGVSSFKFVASHHPKR